ncbi:F0F1 ATP synthase subunit B [Neorhizobium galegae]|uniref:F0F1 ATP synthase subunit B n=1 Tax=Neorhizobium galegae TaxID=399 RepID=UPI000620EA2B|nr:F0F1 ATP synthase subunit B [Neorhizobium galegae]MCQ1573199.1 F0F1 ATP synthase subunit B [Neorhizobium galegae]MCQ1834197.1 F0F1 ATP synthase subunit B [Neorhizobium galegae]UIY30149.1 F0F1 ATP synthase subunit B [Neorhizobium galegae]CDZ65696.1 F0F1-type ATP synthase, beta subunit [Neorhizobium galegae bv. orientalis]
MFVTSAYAQTAPAATDPHAAPAGEAHTETGAHGGGTFPPFDATHFSSQLLWLVITFGLFYLLMKKVIVPRVGGILEHRHDRIAQDLDEAARLKAEADAAVETYEKELAAARSKGHKIAETAREAAKTKAAADRTAIEAELAEKLAAAETRIGEIKAKAFAEVGQIAEETATAIVDQLIGAKASGDDIKAAVAAAKTEA